MEQVVNISAGDDIGGIFASDEIFPAPGQGVGESGRPCRIRTAEIAGSNPAALTIIGDDIGIGPVVAAERDIIINAPIFRGDGGTTFCTPGSGTETTRTTRLLGLRTTRYW